MKKLQNIIGLLHLPATDLSTTYFIWCMTSYTMRRAHVSSKVTRSTKLQGAQHSPELGLGSMDFRAPENLIFQPCASMLCHSLMTLSLMMTHLNVYLTFLMTHFQAHLTFLTLLPWQHPFPSQHLWSNHGSAACWHQSHWTSLHPCLAVQLVTKHCALCAPLSASWTDNQLKASAPSSP